MKIKEISWRNVASYGNNLQKIVFEEDRGNFFLVVGSNGAGKCLDKDTNIEITFSDEKQQIRFEKFLKERTRLDI